MKYPWSVFAGPGISEDMVAVMIFALAPATCPQSASPFSSGKVPVSSPPHRSRKTHFVDTLGLFQLLQLRKSATRGRPPWAPKKLLPGASLCQIFSFFPGYPGYPQEPAPPEKALPGTAAPHFHDSADYPGNPISLPKTEVRLLTPHGPGEIPYILASRRGNLGSPSGKLFLYTSRILFMPMGWCDSAYHLI